MYVYLRALQRRRMMSSPKTIAKRYGIVMKINYMIKTYFILSLAINSIKFEGIHRQPHIIMISSPRRLSVDSDMHFWAKKKVFFEYFRYIQI